MLGWTGEDGQLDVQTWCFTGGRNKLMRKPRKENILVREDISCVSIMKGWSAGENIG